MSTRRIFVIAALIALLAVAFAGCGKVASAGGGPQGASVAVPARQTDGGALPYTISVNGVGVASAPPDVAFIDLGVEIVNTDAHQAFSENTKRMTGVMEVLKTMNIQDEDIQTVNYSMWIEQVYDREGQPTGEARYHVVHQIRVRLRDQSKTGELLQEALEAGANTAGGISFGVADPVALQREARERAIADARAKAEQLASGLGAVLGLVRQVSEYGGSISPAPMAPMMAEGVGGGGGSVPVSSGESTVRVEIQVIFDIAE